MKHRLYISALEQDRALGRQIHVCSCRSHKRNLKTLSQGSDFTNAGEQLLFGPWALYLSLGRCYEVDI